MVGLIPHFYLIELLMYRDLSSLCQCPLGLIPHFYLLAVCMVKIEELVSMPSRAYTSFLLTTLRSLIISMSVICVNALSGLYLISTNDTNDHWYRYNPCVNALSGLYLISTVPLQKPRFYAVSRACFCRYLSEYSDNSCFSCMLTFWTYLMRCTYP